MLAMTEEAAKAVEAIVSQPDTPESAVLRITATASQVNGAGAGGELQITLVDHPENQDVVVSDMRLSFEPGSLVFLDDKVLDAELGDDEVTFSLYPQPGSG